MLILSQSIPVKGPPTYRTDLQMFDIAILKSLQLELEFKHYNSSSCQRNWNINMLFFKILHARSGSGQPEYLLEIRILARAGIVL